MKERQGEKRQDGFAERRTSERKRERKGGKGKCKLHVLGKGQLGKMLNQFFKKPITLKLHVKTISKILKRPYRAF